MPLSRKQKIIKIKILRERKSRELIGSFYLFLLHFWDVLVTEKMIEAPYHKYMCDQLQLVGELVVERSHKEHDLIFNVPPGSTKSVIIGQALNGWLWACDASIRLICASASDKLALESADKALELVTCEEYKKLFPHVILKKGSEGKSNFKTTKGGQRWTTSVGGSVTGMHAHVKISDDLIDVQNADSDVKRLGANNFLTGALNSRNVDPNITVSILVMQRVHEFDPTAIALKKWRRVKHIKLPSELIDGVSPKEAEKLYVNGLLDPVRKNKTVLADELVSLGSQKYSGQYRQDPTPEKGGIISKDWFRLITQREFDMMCMEDSVTPVWNFATDTAYTKNEDKNDPSGMMSYSFVSNRMFIRFFEHQWLEFPELCKWVPKFVNEHGYTDASRVYVEPKASGKSLVQYMARHSKYNVIEDKAPTGSKVDRAKGCSPKIEAGKVYIIVDPLNDSWVDPFLDSIHKFPNSGHDEDMDTLAIAIRRCFEGGGKVLEFG